MNSSELKISFLTRATIDLADNEKVSIWEPTRGGSININENSINLEGKWRVSAIGNFLGSGLLGELLIKPFFLKDRSENISFQNIERLLVHTKKKKTTFHIFQSREGGMVEVHIFRANETISSNILNVIKMYVPKNLLKEEMIT